MSVKILLTKTRVKCKDAIHAPTNPNLSPVRPADPQVFLEDERVLVDAVENVDDGIWEGYPLATTC